MPKGKSYATDQKDGGLVPIEKHAKRAAREHRKRKAMTKRGHAGGAPSHWNR